MEKDYLGGCLIEDNYPLFGKGDVGTWAPQVWDKLIEWYNPKTLIDVGCGAGHSLKYFLDRNIEGIGVEGYLPAIKASSVKNFIKVHDYVEGEFVPEKNYDLAWCCEFVEHVEEQHMKNFMKTFEYCNIVAMTHAVPGQPGYHHVNCQNPEYWIHVFDKIGFKFLEKESLELRDILPTWENDENGNPKYVPNGSHVKNSLMLFIKK